MALTKATLKNLDKPGDPAFECLFNPTEYTNAVNVKWKPKNANGREIPSVEYTGGDNATIKAQLFFDANEPRRVQGREVSDVRYFVDKLMEFTKPLESTKNQKTKRARPPYLLLQWGRNFTWKGVVTSLSTRYTLFKESGEPVRCTVDIQMMQVPGDARGTNPTSFAEPGQRRRVIQPQDTLAVIAFQEYGDASRWRDIADANRLDDPLALRPGDVLAIPSASR